jgi:hypothetical protein
MGEVERVSLKKVYVGRVALLGFIFGLFLSVILSIVSVLVVSTGMVYVNPNYTLFDVQGNAAFYLGLCIFIVCATFFTGVFLGLISAIYNFIVRIGLDMHVGLLAMGPDAKPNTGVN